MGAQLVSSRLEIGRRRHWNGSDGQTFRGGSGPGRTCVLWLHSRAQLCFCSRYSLHLTGVCRPPLA
jgi:hypothetical protein